MAIFLPLPKKIGNGPEGDHPLPQEENVVLLDEHYGRAVRKEGDFLPPGCRRWSVPQDPVHIAREFIHDLLGRSPEAGISRAVGPCPRDRPPGQNFSVRRGAPRGMLRARENVLAGSSSKRGIGFPPSRPFAERRRPIAFCEVGSTPSP